jgi:hypothetical protein
MIMKIGRGEKDWRKEAESKGLEKMANLNKACYVYVWK